MDDHTSQTFKLEPSLKQINFKTRTCSQVRVDQLGQQHLGQDGLTPRQRKQKKYAQSEKGQAAKARYESSDKGIAARCKSQQNWRIKNERYASNYNRKRCIERRNKYNDLYHPETKGTLAYDYYAFEEVPEEDINCSPQDPAKMRIREILALPFDQFNIKFEKGLI